MLKRIGPVRKGKSSLFIFVITRIKLNFSLACLQLESNGKIFVPLRKGKTVTIMLCSAVVHVEASSFSNVNKFAVQREEQVR